MKRMIFTFALFLSAASSATALEKIITIESPVEIVSAPSGGDSAYWVKDQNQTRYRVVVPSADRTRFETMINSSPASVLRFDGTVVDNDADRVLNVNKWGSISTTTTTTDQNGNTRTVEKTTVINPR